MAEGIESVGEVMMGGLLAKAIEPGTGEVDARAPLCLNCGAALFGAYCHRCGQSGHVHRSLAAWWHDFAHGVLHLDGKLWRTLPLLAWRPGELTRRYIAGERARFVSPIALFLFSVFLMYAVLSAMGGPISLDTPAEAAAEAREAAADHAEQRARVADLAVERQRILKAGGDARDVDAELEEAERELRTGGRIGIETGYAPLDAAIKKANENPALLLYKIQASAYKFSWALIPLSVPFLWLLFFWRREYRLYDHTVFVTYSIAFMSLGLIALALLRPIGLGDGLVIAAILLVPPAHMYRQLKGAYRLSRAGALWRTVLLLNFAFIAGGLFFMLLVGLGALA